METGWNQGDIDEFVDRLLQHGVRDPSDAHALQAASDLVPNAWSTSVDADISLGVGAQGGHAPALQAFLLRAHPSRRLRCPLLPRV